MPGLEKEGGLSDARRVGILEKTALFAVSAKGVARRVSGLSSKGLMGKMVGGRPPAAVSIAAKKQMLKAKAAPGKALGKATKKKSLIGRLGAALKGSKRPALLGKAAPAGMAAKAKGPTPVYPRLELGRYGYAGSGLHGSKAYGLRRRK